MATEVDLTYLGRLFINQYVFKLDVRLQRLYCSADTAIAAAPNTLPMLLQHSDGLSRHRPTDSKYTHGQQRVMFKGIHTLATIKGIKGSD